MNIVEPVMALCIDVPFHVGESPLWDAERNVLWFVDIDAPALFNFDPQTRALTRFDMLSPIGCIGLTQDDRIVAGLKSGGAPVRSAAPCA